MGLVRTPVALLVALALTNGCVAQSQTINLNDVFYTSQPRTSLTGEIYYAFYGIPYARQPVDRFRFTRPEPIGSLFSWGLNEAERKMYNTPKTQPQPCPQIDLLGMPSTIIGKEDCLRVDVYIRKKVFDNQGQLYPIAVLMEGFDFKQSVGHKVQPEKSFFTESSSEFGILAVVHSRLGALGYLTTEDDEGPANLGLWDQHVALEFLRNQADKFKADENRLTVMGFGSGGVAASIHMINNLNTNYFKTAIISGGSALGPDANIRFAKDNAMEFGKEVGCTSSTTRKFIGCLRRVELGKLVNASAHPRFVFGPTADKSHTSDTKKSYLSDWPKKLAMKATFDNVKIVVYGYPENSGTFRFYSIPANTSTRMIKPNLFNTLPNNATAKRISRAETKPFSQVSLSLEKRIQTYLAPYQAYGDTLKALSASVKFVYFRGYTDEQVLSDETLFEELMSLALTDYLSFSPVVTLAHVHANAKVEKRRTSGVYIYVRKAEPDLSSFRHHLHFASGQQINRGKLYATYMDDLLQFISVEGVSKSDDPDKYLREVWNYGMNDLAKPDETPKSLNHEYNPKDNQVYYIQEFIKSSRSEKDVPYRKLERIFWSSYVPTILDTLDAISLKSYARHGTAVTFQRATWGVSVGLVIICLVAIVLGFVLWKEKSKKVSFKPVPPNDTGRV